MDEPIPPLSGDDLDALLADSPENTTRYVEGLIDTTKKKVIGDLNAALSDLHEAPEKASLSELDFDQLIPPPHSPKIETTGEKSTVTHPSSKSIPSRLVDRQLKHRRTHSTGRAKADLTGQPSLPKKEGPISQDSHHTDPSKAQQRTPKETSKKGPQSTPTTRRKNQTNREQEIEARYKARQKKIQDIFHQKGDIT